MDSVIYQDFWDSNLVNNLEKKIIVEGLAEKKRVETSLLILCQKPAKNNFALKLELFFP